MQENLSLYHVFYTVAKCGSLSQAAKELYVSQPAISRSIQKLEENLETSLFKRNSRGVSLTPAGKALYLKVKEAFALLSQGEEELLHHRFGEIPRLRIGASSTLSKYILLPRLKTYISQHPNVRITISCQSSYQTLQLLEQGQIDLGLIGKPRKLPGYSFFPVQKIQDTFVSTSQYLKSLQDFYPGESLAQTATFMLLDEDNITRQLVDGVLKEHELKLSHILEVSSMELLIQFAEIGMGVACVTREFVKTELASGTLLEVPMGCTFPSRDIGYVCRKNEEEQPLLHSFLFG